MGVSMRKLVWACGAVLVLLTALSVFAISAPSAGDIGGMVADALEGGDTSQTSVQVCVGFLNIGSCRSTQTQSFGRQSSGSGGSGWGRLPVVAIISAAILAVIFLLWIAVAAFPSGNGRYREQ